MNVGIDIESISKFNYLLNFKKIEEISFLCSFFSKKEIKYCMNFNVSRNFAVLFSIKESIIKLLKNYKYSIFFSDVEVLNFYDILTINLSKELKNFESKIFVSFSYDKCNVLSCAILEE